MINSQLIENKDVVCNQLTHWHVLITVNKFCPHTYKSAFEHLYVELYGRPMAPDEHPAYAAGKIANDFNELRMRDDRPKNPLAPKAMAAAASVSFEYIDAIGRQEW